MIRTILVDDEQPALLKMKSLLLPYGEFQVVGAYTDPREALGKLEESRPHVAFLDIAMPEFSGIDLATAIQHKLGYPVQIVFVSAYDEYALTAFEVNATDYLLKPVNRSRFRQTVDRLNDILKITQQPVTPARSVQAEQPPQRLVRLFGKLEITQGERGFGSWRTAKVRELFAFFLHNRGQSIYRETILETLWGHMDTEHALASMNTCNYYLRRQLEESGSGIALSYASSYYSIDLNGAVCDADLFENALALSPLTADNLPTALEASALYRGPYFEDVKGPWAQVERERFAANCAALRAAIAQYYLTQGEWVEAEAYALRALEANALQPQAWKALLRARKAKGDHAGFQQSREKLLHTYQKQFGLPLPQDLAEEVL